MGISQMVRKLVMFPMDRTPDQWRTFNARRPHDHPEYTERTVCRKRTVRQQAVETNAHSGSRNAPAGNQQCQKRPAHPADGPTVGNARQKAKKWDNNCGEHDRTIPEIGRLADRWFVLTR